MRTKFHCTGTNIRHRHNEGVDCVGVDCVGVASLLKLLIFILSQEKLMITFEQQVLYAADQCHPGPKPVTFCGFLAITQGWHLVQQVDIPYTEKQLI